MCAYRLLYDMFLLPFTVCVYTGHCGEPATREWLLPHCGNTMSPWKQSITMGTKGHHENKLIYNIIWYMCTQIFNTKLNQASCPQKIYSNENRYFCQLETFGELSYCIAAGTLPGWQSYCCCLGNHQSWMTHRLKMFGCRSIAGWWLGRALGHGGAHRHQGRLYCMLGREA